MRKLIAVLCLASSCSVALAQSSYAVTRAYADDNGIVHIVTGDGRDHTISPEKDQDGVKEIKVAPDGATVGWLVETSGCCVSYPVPLQLDVWRSGRIIRRVQPSMAIWSWVFIEKGTKLAYRMSPLHGGWSGKWVLINTATGRTLDTWNYPVDENGNDTGDNSGKPAWLKQTP
jgi:hypothetical protein